MSKDLVFTVEFNIKPECVEDFLTSLTAVVENMSKEDSFVSTNLHRDKNDPNKFLIYERWQEDSLEDFMVNQIQGKSYRDSYEERLPGWSSEPRKITVLETVGEWLR
jgi:quinol monooxygenase YgiN